MLTATELNVVIGGQLTNGFALAFVTQILIDRIIIGTGNSANIVVVDANDGAGVWQH